MNKVFFSTAAHGSSHRFFSAMTQPSFCQQLSYYFKSSVQTYVCPSLNFASTALEAFCFSSIHFHRPNLKPVQVLFLYAISKSLLLGSEQFCFKSKKNLLDFDFKFSLIECTLLASRFLALNQLNYLNSIEEELGINPSFFSNRLDFFVKTVFAVSHLALLVFRYRGRS